LKKRENFQFFSGKCELFFTRIHDPPISQNGLTPLDSCMHNDLRWEAVSTCLAVFSRSKLLTSATHITHLYWIIQSTV